MARRLMRDFMEPAHPMLVRQFDALVALYRVIKEVGQRRLDEAFDRASQQIGFVVTTTLPATCTVTEGGKIERFELTGTNLQGTVFHREISPVLQELGKRPLAGIAAGAYPLLLVWHEALKLKLKADWLEPAHFLRPRLPLAVEAAAAKGLPEVREPAHWFDAGVVFDETEQVMIAALDEVYPELNLAERVAVARRASLPYVPGVREPAHFGAGIREPAHLAGVREPAHLATLIDDVLEARAASRQVPGIREPAHFRQIQEIIGREDAARLLDEMMGLLRRYGVQ